jgi:excisionase family DNA binding protein
MEIKLTYAYVKREIDKLVEPQDKMERAIELLAEYHGAKEVFNNDIINILAGRTESSGSLRAKSFLESVIDSYKKVLDKPEKEELFTVKSLAKYLGVSTSSIYKLVETGEIRYSKSSGKIIRFRKAYVEEYLAKGKSSTREEIKNDAMMHQLTYKNKKIKPGKK